jgi:phosphoribosylformimino-5-aminoimidazole carboxamide ribotide isomerase
LQALITESLDLWVDAGVSNPAELLNLANLGAAKIIIGSETLLAADQLTALAEQYPPRKLVLSVDLQDGTLRAPDGIDTPQELVSLAAKAGIQDVILLDLARVGASAGPPLNLLTSLRPLFPKLSFYAGGGVRHRADLETLAVAGAAGALIATAFHRGSLTAADLTAYQI